METPFHSQWKEDEMRVKLFCAICKSKLKKKLKSFENLQKYFPWTIFLSEISHFFNTRESLNRETFLLLKKITGCPRKKDTQCFLYRNHLKIDL